jgi:hypothetical protein
MFALVFPLSVNANAIPSELEIQIHILVNEERTSNANKIEPPLKLHSKLIEVARAHSEDMLQNNFFDHENLLGEKPADRISKEGIQWTLVAENLYESTGYAKYQIAQSAVNGWINSEGHYLNMLSDTTYTGIGIASSDTTYLVTQVFVEASKAHMQEMGIIYDNEKLEQKSPEKDSFQFNQTYFIIAVSVFIILIGRDARRRNRNMRRR